MNLIFNPISTITSVHKDLLLEADPSLALIQDYLEKGMPFDVVLDKKIVGVFVLLKTRPHTLEIMNISVNSDYQRQGIGQQILIFINQFAKENGYTLIEIGTGSTSIYQLYLYQKMGFRVSDIDRDFFSYHYSEEIIENGLVLKDMIRLEKRT